MKSLLQKTAIDQSASNPSRESSARLVFGRGRTENASPSLLGASGLSSTCLSSADGSRLGDLPFQEDTTVELEGDVTALLAKASDPALMSPIDQSRIEPAEISAAAFSSPGANSVDMADAESLASAHSRPTAEGSSFQDRSSVAADEEDDSPGRVERLDFERSTDRPFSPVPEERSSQMESSNSSSSVANSSSSVANGSSSAVLKGATVGFASGIAPPNDRMSFGDRWGCAGTDSSRESSVNSTSQEESSLNLRELAAADTVELEGGANSLLDKIGDVRNRSASTMGGSTIMGESTMTEGVTVELEGDMVALVAATSGGSNESSQVLGKSVDTSGDNISGENSASGESQSSRGDSTSFLMSPPPKVALSIKRGKVVQKNNGGARHASDERDDSPVGSDSERSRPSSRTTAVRENNGPLAEQEVVDLTWEEILKASNLQLADKEATFLSKEEFLFDACRASTKSGNVAIAEVVREFFGAVCREVEGRSENGSALDEFNALLEGGFPSAVDLQRKIRSARRLSGSRSVNNNEQLDLERLRSLASSARDNILSEWRTWETEVADALRHRIAGVSEGIDDEERAVDRNTNFAEDTHESISIMAGRAVRKARRRSMRRRRKAASDMEKEIRELERQVEDAEAALESNREKHRALQSTTEVLAEIDDAMTDASANRTTAGSSKDMLTAIENFGCWTPVVVNTEVISLVFTKFANQPSLLLKFHLADPSQISYSTSLIPSNDKRARIKKATRLYKCGPGVVPYVKSHLESLCKRTSGEKLASQGDIAPVLQRVELELCRLETTTREITSLQGRFRAKFEREKDGGCGEDFNLSLALVGHDGELAVSASFLVSRSYPFGPMETSITPTKGGMNLDSLRRQLIKTAKPGFGYLTRTIDVIRASIRSRP